MSRHETSPTTVQPASNHRPNACCFCWCCCCSCSWYVPSSDSQGTPSDGRWQGHPRAARLPCLVWHQALGLLPRQDPGFKGDSSLGAPQPAVQLTVPAGSGGGRAAGMEPAPLTKPSLRAAGLLGLRWEMRGKPAPQLEKGINVGLEQMDISGATVCCSPPCGAW